MNSSVTKAVIAAAGFGSRFLPATKAVPKEMLPLVDKPVIQYLVEELVEAGITDIIVVTSDGKPSIEAHFREVAEDLKQNLLDGGKHELLDKAEATATIANFTFVKQSGPYGNATPIINAAHLLNGEPFIYAFADDLMLAKPNRTQQLIATHEALGGSVITCTRRDGDADYARYGYVGGYEIEDGVLAMDGIVEKPKSRELSPSSLASVGGYLFEPVFLDYLNRQLANHDGSKEFMMQESMQQMIDDGHKFYGREILGGHWYDTGTPIEYMKTVFDFAMTHSDIGVEFREYVLAQSKHLIPPLFARHGSTPLFTAEQTTKREKVAATKRRVDTIHF